jgi:hypothetical protein
MDLQAMLISAAAASGSMLTVGRWLGLEGVWRSLGVLQASRGVTLGLRYWFLDSPLSVTKLDDRAKNDDR